MNSACPPESSRRHLWGKSSKTQSKYEWKEKEMDLRSTMFQSKSTCPLFVFYCLCSCAGSGPSEERHLWHHQHGWKAQSMMRTAQVSFAQTPTASSCFIKCVACAHFKALFFSNYRVTTFNIFLPKGLFFLSLPMKHDYCATNDVRLDLRP